MREGIVQVERNADRIVVTIQASFWPFAGWAGVFFAAAFMDRLPLLLAAPFAVYIALIPPFASRGMRAIARSALSGRAA